jgi:hypothetical protein
VAVEMNPQPVILSSESDVDTDTIPLHIEQDTLPVTTEGELIPLICLINQTFLYLIIINETQLNFRWTHQNFSTNKS